MDIRFLKSLLATVDKGSIAEAARSLALTPAAVGQRIRALEVELGVDLLSRVGHNAVASANCLKMLPRIRDIVRNAEELIADTDETGLAGILKVGAISTALTDFMPDVLHRFQSDYPSIQLHIVPGSSVDLYEQLLAHEVDAALLVEPPFAVPTPIVVAPVCEQPLVFLAKNKSSRSIAERMNSEPYVAYDPSAWGGAMVERFRAAHYSTAKPLCVLDSPEIIARLVSEQLGVSILPRWHGLDHFSNELYISPPLTKRLRRKIALVYRPNSIRAPMIDVLRLTVETTARQ